MLTNMLPQTLYWRQRTHLEQVAHRLGANEEEAFSGLESENSDAEVDLEYGFDDEVLTEYCELGEASDDEENSYFAFRTEESTNLDEYDSEKDAEYELDDEFYMEG